MTNGVVSAHKERVTDAREITESDGIVVMENRKFTNTALPVCSGAEGWYQHIHIVQAIVKSNGWPDETAALQLFVHLKGEALDVALLHCRPGTVRATTAIGWICTGYPDRGNYGQLSCMGESFRLKQDSYGEL